MKRYAIWNKKDDIITRTGEIYTAEQWIAKHPMFGLDNVTAVCAAGETNGSFYIALGDFVNIYTSYGCDFSGCNTDEEKLEAIEAFMDAREAAEAEAVANAKMNENITADSLASIAASLEFQNMLALEDVEV